jgi:galactose-6-phosphate isomerase
MADLDVTDILCDPDFMDTDLICQRISQVIGTDGVAVNTPVNIPFAGVVTSDKGDILERIATGERIKGSILICTQFRLIDGTKGYTADIVLWRGNSYTVASVNDYSHFGPGFVEANCDLKELSG